MQNALTVDVEDWFQTHDLNFERKSWGNFENRVDQSTKLILEALAEHGIRGTFFILGWVADEFPGLVREIADQGHEIASHGRWHTKITEMNREQFRQDARHTKSQLEEITGQEVKVFRAPSWSISTDTLWALEILQEEGYSCDSSIQPFKTPLSGIQGAPPYPYHPIINGTALRILEYPPTTLQFGKIRFPFAGGLYFRLLPYLITKIALKRVNKKANAMVYFHPWEFDAKQPRLKVSPLVQVTHYVNLDKNLQKVNNLLQDFNFVPLSELIAGCVFPKLPVQTGTRPSLVLERLENAAV